MIRVIEAFSGYGSQSMALERAGVEFEVVGIMEIDKYAVEAYRAVHGDVVNFGDISKVNERELPDHDLFTYSFPCQDISVSGNLAGVHGTRSGLLWECDRIIAHKRPRFLLMENVKNLVGKRFRKDFDKWCSLLESYGYVNHWQVVNSKDHGVPQNRERVFMVSVLDCREYEFPEKEELGTFLCDVTEDVVDERFYLKEEAYAGLIEQIVEKYENQDASYCIDTNYYKGGNGNQYVNKSRRQLVVKEATKRGFKEAYVGDSINLEQPNSKTRRGRVGSQVANTLTTGCNQAVVESTKKILRYERTEYGKKIRKDYETGIIKEKISNMRTAVPREDGISNTLTTVQKDNHLLDGVRVRKLTPLEYFRLMDVSDNDFYKIRNALNEKFYKGKDRSSSQLYKLAGNSIVVRPLEKIFRNLFK